VDDNEGLITDLLNSITEFVRQLLEALL